MRALLLALVLVSGCGGFFKSLNAPQQPEQQEEEKVDLVRLVLDNTLALATKEGDVYSPFCSGVAVDGTFLTASHCLALADDEELHVKYRGNWFRAVGVRDWPEKDLAVIEVLGAKTENTLEVSPWEPQYGMRVVWSGYPMGEHTLRLFAGIVAAPKNLRVDHYFDVDGQIIPGNSGGPFVDERGRVLGIVSASAVAAMLVPQLIDIGHGVRPEFIRTILSQ